MRFNSVNQGTYIFPQVTSFQSDTPHFGVVLSLNISQVCYPMPSCTFHKMLFYMLLFFVCFVYVLF